MKIIFDHSQTILRKIVALKNSQQEFTVVCPECEYEIDSTSVGNETLTCKKCGYFAKLEDKPLSKREQVWEQFDNLQDKK